MKTSRANILLSLLSVLRISTSEASFDGGRTSISNPELEGNAVSRQCSEVEAGGPSSFLASKITFGVDDLGLLEVVELLQARHRLPISFVDHGGTRPVTLTLADVTVLTLLQALVATQDGEYRCLVIHRRIVLIPDDPRLLRRVSGVDVKSLARFGAARRYVQHLAALEEFKGMTVFGGGLLDTSLFADHVTLSNEATVLEHLVELLGDNPGVFFLIQRAPNGHEYLTMGSAMQDQVAQPGN